VKAFPRLAISSGPFCPAASTLALKSCTAFPNHILTIRKDVIPIRNPKNPTHADSRCTIGFSNMTESLPPILWRKEIKVKEMKKSIDNAIATEMNAGVVAVGADKRRFELLPGRTARSYKGETEASVQLMLAALFFLEHEPNNPIKTLGPSTPFDDPVWINAVEGTTAKSETRS